MGSSMPAAGDVIAPLTSVDQIAASHIGFLLNTTALLGGRVMIAPISGISTAFA